MKKKFLILVAFLLTGIIALSACALRKTAITAEEFLEKAEAAGFKIDEYVSEECVYALKYGNEIEIEFIVYSSIANAKYIFSSEKYELEWYSGSSSSVSALNYEYYKITSGGFFYVVFRVDNTFVYAWAYAKHKNEVNDFLKSIGY